MIDPERQPLIWRVKALAEALEGSEVGELDFSEGGVRILIKRRQDTSAFPAVSEVRMRPRRVVSQHRAHVNGSGRTKSAHAEHPAPEPGVAVVAPLTGVFYSSPSPNSPKFVNAGDPVQPGQVVCIIEAMKVFNEIKSEVSGGVLAVLPKDGQLVQKGDALIRIKPV